MVVRGLKAFQNRVYAVLQSTDIKYERIHQRHLLVGAKISHLQIIARIRCGRCYIPRFWPVTNLLIHPPQLLWNSSTANSPDSARVYRHTIAPEVQPAAALTDVSETPLRRLCTAQPRRHECADGALRRFNIRRTVFDCTLNSDPSVRP